MYPAVSFSAYSLPVTEPFYDSPLSLPPMFYAHIFSPSYILEKYILSMINTVVYGPTYDSAGTVTCDVMR
jgi:hypothetical protein